MRVSALKSQASSPLIGTEAPKDRPQKRTQVAEVAEPAIEAAAAPINRKRNRSPEAAHKPEIRHNPHEKKKTRLAEAAKAPEATQVGRREPVAPRAPRQVQSAPIIMGTKTQASSKFEVYRGRPAIAPMQRPSKERPIYKLSKQLLSTYNKINKIYYEKKQRQEQAAAKKYEQQVQAVGVGSPLKKTNGEVLGGAYGRLHKVHNSSPQRRVNPNLVAKMQSPHKRGGDYSRYSSVADMDAKALKYFNNKGVRNIPKLHTALRQKNTKGVTARATLVMTNAGPDLYRLYLDQTSRDYIGPPSFAETQEEGRAILEGLSDIHALDFLHGDLKPENLAKKTILDLGGVKHIPPGQKIMKLITSRFYRAPEMMLDIPYNQKVDSWSLGCVLFELYTGEVLFPANDPRADLPENQKRQAAINAEVDHLQVMKKRMMGANPLDYLVANPGLKRAIVSEDGTLKPHSRPEILANIVSIPEKLEATRQARGDSVEDLRKFEDLLRGLLQYDPSNRLSSANALALSFFQTQIAEPNLIEEPAATSRARLAPGAGASSSRSLFSTIASAPLPPPASPLVALTAERAATIGLSGY